MFPKALPRAAVRSAIHKEKIRRELSVREEEPEKASVRGIIFKFIGQMKIMIIFIFFRYVYHFQKTFKEFHTDVQQYIITVLLLWIYAILDLHTKIY